MYDIFIEPSNYRFLLLACSLFDAKVRSSEMSDVGYLTCSVDTVAEQLFYIGRAYERMVLESEYLEVKDVEKLEPRSKNAEE